MKKNRPNHCVNDHSDLSLAPLQIQERNARCFDGRNNTIQTLKYRCLGLLAASCNLQDTYDEIGMTDLILTTGVTLYRGAYP